jgi:hypothetical protein
VTDANVAELTATAKTAADHEALAAYYQAKAAEAAEKVEFHEAMLRSVRKAGSKQYSAMRPHCRTLIRSSRAAQESYEDLAEIETQLAKEAQK